jgi:hypothetical protein
MLAVLIKLVANSVKLVAQAEAVAELLATARRCSEDRDASTSQGLRFMKPFAGGRGQSALRVDSAGAATKEPDV